MPGMLDTVLNLGLGDESVVGLAESTGNERFAWDSYRRLVQMFGNVVRGIPGERFEDEIAEVKREDAVQADSELDAAALRRLTERFKEIVGSHSGDPFPQDPLVQLRAAIRAVFDSWGGERAVTYRRIHGIPDSWGTAVNVQQMVFGNRGETSCSGVAFSRDEITGAPEPSGDFLWNAQGEDVVSGVRTPDELSALAERMPEAHARLLEILRTLERHYGDMQDTEFTVEEGRLYMLQTRSAKRPAQAGVRFAVDAVAEGLLTRERALLTIDASTLDALLLPTFDPAVGYDVVATGVAASPGAARGEIALSADQAKERAATGADVILVRPFTEADDVAGFHVARGILTSEGGKASHAALVARGMGRPAVCGAAAVRVDLAAETVEIGERLLRPARDGSPGDAIAINGSTGEITLDEVPLVQPEMSGGFETVLEWADELRRLGVRANADTPHDASRARSLGAEGIGLCRTEHMFMATDRAPKVRAMIMAAETDERVAALEELLPLQRGDFEGLFEAMAGLPVTIRLLDPPLHEFLPPLADLERRLALLEGTGDPAIPELQSTLDRVRTLQETNPMLGTRGCRLGILYPEIYDMQARAIGEAAAAVAARSDEPPHLEVMIPLVAYERELELVRDRVAATIAAAGPREGRDFVVGTMIELPRACLLADRIATHADFFSFGTNDLTQTTLGFSRDDIEASFLDRYEAEGVVDRSPFETIDTPGVGELVKMGARLGRSVKPELKLGICGEHGGDPDSIAFFHTAGLDYVSCSPFRVPVARVAAAQAAIRADDGDGEIS